MAKKLPDRWTSYTKMGNLVPGTRFLPVKVPLKSSLTTSLPMKQHFSPKDLLDLAKEKGFKIGLVIDLSFTSRYYSSEEFTQHGIKYFKIFMPGRQIPNRAIMTQFYDAVLQFEKENAHNFHSIVVHCTHGLNRTGYMICRFMMEKMNMTADQAITKFNRARGHDIERDVYLNDLRSFSEVSVLKAEEHAEANLHFHAKVSSQRGMRSKPSLAFHNRKKPPVTFYHSSTNPYGRAASYQHNYSVAPYSNKYNPYTRFHYTKPYDDKRKFSTFVRDKSHSYYRSTNWEDNKKNWSWQA